MTKSVILVTGGGGFIGSHLVQQLVEEGAEVRVLEQPGAQLEEVYYNRKPDQPAYNYRLYFQVSSDRAPAYDHLRQRLDEILTGFVHTFGTGYDAWAGSDARGTAVLLSDRDVRGFVEIQVHVAFPTPRW